MAINWTEKQLRAIEKSGCNLIVSAAAGSGKTAVLVERILRKITDENVSIDIESLLITTFTEAAAVKMKEDIKAAILNKIANDDENAEQLTRQLILLPKADISTIHAFCLRVIKSNFHLLDLDPDFRIGNESEIQLIKNQALDNVFLKNYESGNEEFYELLDAYSSQRGDDRLREMILKAYEFVKSMPFYKKWIDMVINDYDNIENFEKTKFFDFIISQIEFEVKKYISQFRVCADICAAADTLSSYESAFLSDIASLEAILDALKGGDMKKMGDALLSFSPTSARAKKGADENDKKYIQGIRKKSKDGLYDIYAKFFKDREENIERLKQSKVKVRTILNLIIEFDEEFTNEKREKALVDFNDIEHLCLDILSEVKENGEVVASESAMRLRDKYEEILIDEYQDANEMQETIFSLISRGNNVFMVGDLKQSIYRFRHTNPLIFKNKMNTYSDDSGENQRVIMSENFRSRESVINFVNFIFAQVSSETIGEMTYDETERLNFAADYPEAEGENVGGNCELLFVRSSVDEDDEESEKEVLVGLEAEAQAVCTRIKQLLSSGFKVYDKKEGYRKAKLSDMVILMRSPTVSAGIFSKVLEENGIGAFADVSSSYYETEEIGVIMSLLSVVDNPRQDIALLSVMRSPIFGFEDEEFVYIRAKNYDGDVYDSVLNYIEKGNDEKLREKCRLFIEKLNKWRNWASYMQANELIDALYNDTNYYAYVGAMSGGDVRRANLRLLRKRAEAFEKTSYKGLFNFINFIENTNKMSGEGKGARMLGENQDVVRIMSIHKSKGLEFPVVFVACLDRGFNLRDLTEPVLMHKKYGIGIDHIDCDLRYKYPLPIKNIIKTATKNEQLSEEMRLLYVALTRAREKLVLVTAPSRYEEKMRKWEEIAAAAESVSLPVYSCAEAKTYCDWIVPACMRSSEGKKITEGRIAVLDIKSDLEIKITNEVAFEADGVYNEDTKEKNDIIYERVCKILDYRYDKSGAMIPQKLSVTELKRVFDTELDGERYIEDNTRLLKCPSFMEEERQAFGALKGTATHYIMQNIDLKAEITNEYIDSLAQRFFEEGIFSDKQKAAIDKESIIRFFESEIGRKMINSERVEREIAFEINMRAADIYNDYKGEEKILVQGIIDCYFFEGDKVILLDYKTDSLKNISGGLINKYKVQLDVYARALLEKMKEKEIEKYIYFFSSGEAMRI